jgi:tetratricopeptide (TPR) repeat protein
MVSPRLRKRHHATSGGALAQADALADESKHLRERGRDADALAAVVVAQELLRGVDDRDEKTVVVWEKVAGILGRLGRDSDAASSLDRAIDIRRRLLADGVDRTPRYLAAHLKLRATLYGRAGQRDEAIVCSRELVPLRRDLARDGSARNLAPLADELLRLARWLGADAHRQEALVFSNEAVEVARRLAAMGASQSAARLGIALGLRSGHEFALGRYTIAVATSDESVTLLRSARASSAPSAGFLLHLTQHSSHLTSVGRAEAALAAASEALEGARAATTETMGVAHHAALRTRSNCLSHLCRSSEALASGIAALDQANRLDNGSWLGALRVAETMVALGLRLHGVGREADAIAQLDAATPLLGRESVHEHHLARRTACAMEDAKALALHGSGRDPEAAESAQRAVTIARALVEANPGEFDGELSGALDQLAGCLCAVGRPEEATAPAEEAREVRRRSGAEVPVLPPDGRW